MRLVFESGRPIAQVARDLGLPAETLRRRVRQAEIDARKREGFRSEEREEIRRLKLPVRASEQQSLERSTRSWEGFGV
jgi:transposase